MLPLALPGEGVDYALTFAVLPWWFAWFFRFHGLKDPCCWTAAAVVLLLAQIFVVVPLSVH